MKIVVNGKEEQVAEAISVTELLNLKNVEMPEMVSVELNEEILERTAFETTHLNKDDQVEFLYFMGGGRSETGDTCRNRDLIQGPFTVTL